jgi:pimeloyl-ACP methyl ester carboxylesterase
VSAGGRVRILRHNRIELALHELVEGEGRPLLLLHGLGECAPEGVPPALEWPGPVYALDFTGHGGSTVPRGGGYTSEILVGDADAALESIGEPVSVLGRGLGAYVGLLLSAARPDQVVGAVLADGPGLAGGGVQPGSAALIRAVGSEGTPDRFALLELSRDVRPPDYAQTFVRFVVEESRLEFPLWVSARVRPPWIEAVVQEPGVGKGTVAEGLALYAGT